MFATFYYDHRDIIYFVVFRYYTTTHYGRDYFYVTFFVEFKKVYILDFSQLVA